MLTENELKGIYVPVVTPMGAGGEVDIRSFESYVKQLLEDGVNGIVVNGTTGEAPTVTLEEMAALTAAARLVCGPMNRPVIVGTGTNDTASTVRKTAFAGELGADAALVVVPYYSRPSQEGIIEHYRQAASTGLPIVAYEIPSRTGIRLAPDTVRAILDLDGVIGIKDSSGGIELMIELASSGDHKPVLCGEDIYFHAMLCCGAAGGMLASASVRTTAFAEVYEQLMKGQLEASRQSFGALLPLIRLLFQEPNPAPLKYLLARQGIIASDHIRLPLTPVSEKLRQQLNAWL
ncbi:MULTISPECIES: 4-hydroxy-tetrahydrodipicolinate synthase [unclassified Paenibacillus]|uniref:4-hydroxy-tetrahydrodipicolinate synthase n=1 Tax=unclassified Paenibacillus TaxID=185978 RepID=UPI00104F4A42|nr:MULTISPECIES: 4-hydroxy-tetrahydrodipicolinate synthase [unclassified Paenibacillus]NIK71163.1 4-hydroxy-tetrahydrodipicolinate synthase [Paenibacillus sp. BK720]TCM97116.1 4-hydroxy-tetrahydrodipicolinate synthase [Paenibacillus sp. BK033]